MAAQKGRDLLIKIADDNNDFVTVAGLRSKSIKFNARLVDITNADSAQGWRELLPGAGIKSVQITGSGIFKDAASDAIARQAFFDQSGESLQIIIPDFGMIEGLFLITALTYIGQYDGEARYDLSLSSAGAPSFIAQ